MSDEFTVGDLRQALDGLPDDTKLEFHAGLTFYRVKWWGDDKVGIEFDEFEAELSPAFRKRHPNILAAFCRADPPLSGDVIAQSSYVPRL